jgi:hypothetical protein
MYAAWTGSSWTTQTVDSSEKVINSALSLALDSNNTPPILYAQSPNSNGINNPTAVRYAELSGSGWNIQSILPNINMGSLGNMVLDSDDYPHFTYCANETLNYDSWNGSAWNSQTVASTYYSNFSAYLALDSHNYPHIVYYNEANDSFIGALMYASWTGKAWSIQTIDANNATGAGDIVLDPNGNPHISYPAQPPNAGQPSSIKYLNYATITEPTPTSTATPAPTNEFALLIIVPVFTVIVLATLAYIWKKKTRK